MKFLQGLGNDFYSDSLSGSGNMGATASDKIKLELQKRAEQKTKNQGSGQQQGNQAQAAPQRPTQQQPTQQPAVQRQQMTREQCDRISSEMSNSRYRSGQTMPLECSEWYDDYGRSLAANTDRSRGMDLTLGAAHDYGFQDRIGYQGEIVPLGVVPTPLKIPTIGVPSTTASSAVKLIPKIKTQQQQREIDTKRYVAQQTNSEKNYVGATITPFQVKEGLVAKFNLRNVPSVVLAMNSPDTSALFDILRYAVFTKKITDAQNRELRLKSGVFDGGPQIPLTFQQWLALVDQAFALQSIPVTTAPIPAGGGSQQADTQADAQTSESTEDTKEGLSTGAMIGIGIGTIAVLGGIGFMIARRKKS